MTDCTKKGPLYCSICDAKDQRISELEIACVEGDKLFHQIADQRDELLRKYEALVEIKTLLEQMVDMNGAEYFWKHLSRMPISKFNGPLRALLKETDDE